MNNLKIAERFLDEHRAAARIHCAPTLIPAPGQYLLAHDPASDSAPLAAPVFCASRLADGFLAAAPLPRAWTPGLMLSVRGPLGRGFRLPASARRVVLAAQDVSPSLLLSLLEPAFAQGASVALTCDAPPDDLPAQVEIQPWRALKDLCHWADYLALGVTRESLPGLVADSGLGNPLRAVNEMQIFVAAPMPCGGVGQCGVCSVVSSRGFKLACEDGPVFDLAELF